MPVHILQAQGYEPPTRKPAGDSQRKRILGRLKALRNERSSWDAHWKEVADQILPRRQRFQQNDRNKGTKRNDKIINLTPTRALRVLASGMMAGITSPARPWFKLTTPDPELAEVGTVRAWLHNVEGRLREAFARSNWYNALPTLYTDLGGFGTSPLLVDEDPDDFLRAYVLPVGSYYLANGPRLTVDTLYRELSMTASQLVERFGIGNCSLHTRDLYNRGDYDQWVEVLHIVEPRRDREYGRADSLGMPWKSCWLEVKGDDSTGFLAESGYEEFPVMAPRWDVTGEDVYGTGPGMDALGDAKALQVLERRKGQAVDKIVNPPMVGPAYLKTQRASIMPGDMNYEDGVSVGHGFRPALQVPPQAVGVLNESIARHEERLNSAFFADLWLMLADTDRRNITAREVAERHEEKMLQLGPVLERLQDELLDPAIDRTFAILLRRGVIPPPPEELQGVELKVELISILAQAQKLVSTAGVERLVTLVGSLSETRPDIGDKINWDEVVDQYADMLGTPPDLVMSDEAVAEIRARRAEQEQARAQGEAMLAATEGARNLSQADLEGDSALTRMLGGLGPVAATAVGGGGA